MGNIRNATIKSTSLGNDDHGPSAWLYLDYGGAGQGFGGYALGKNFTHFFIFSILNTLEVDSWEHLKGTPLRVEQDHEGISRIGHYLDDKWFNPKDFKKDSDGTKD